VNLKALRPWPSVWVLTLALLFAGCTVRNIIYPVPMVEVGSPPTRFEEVEIESAEGIRFVGWHHPGDAAGNRPVLIFFHGNGENLETLKWTGLFDQLLSLQAPVLVVDYPGYGRSSGVPSESSLKGSAERALDWVASRYPDRGIVPTGWSLGAAVAVYLAAARPDRVRGLIAMSPWTSLAAVAEIHFPHWLVGLGLREHYDSLGLVDQIAVPALMIHGSIDRIIPIEQGRQLAAALTGAAWVEVGTAGHNDLLSSPVVWREMSQFVSRLSAPSAL
jgi:pimeloyl-ACP methyl ester carboxylesterase